MTDRLIATYHVRSTPQAIAARASGIAVEQSVEMPVEGIEDRSVLDTIVGRVEDIVPLSDTLFAVRIALATATVEADAGQLFNMLFGNTSIQDDVTLEEAELPEALVAAFPGPNLGIQGLRTRAGVPAGRALTCGALKPQGLPPAGLAALAARMAQGGMDYLKDDHGLADQAYSPFAARLRAVAAALRAAAQRTGKLTRYIPSLSGNLDAMRRQIDQALAEGIDCFLIAPIIAGLSTFATLAREFPAAGFMTHPTLSGIARIAPPLFYGRLFRLIGADAVVYPNHGGRFGYSPATCAALAAAARTPWAHLRPTLPVPAGGMTPERVAEMLDFYGPDTIVLIGGALLAARDRLTEQVAAFTAAVATHRFAQVP
jgi:ribulose-bisphosphate carboxylase large chain